MAFPSSPSNNQTTIVNGIRYVYSSTKQAWTKIASASTSTDQFARDTANTASSNTIIIQGVDVTQNTRITAVDTYAGSSYSQANAANNLAQSAFNKSNSANVLAQASFDAANTASSNTIYTQGVDVWQNTRITAVDSFAQAAYNKANTGGEYAIDNVARLTANAAFDKANSANILAQAAFNQANTGGGSSLDQYARDTANSASSNTIIIQGVDVWQNTRMTAIEAYAQSAYSTANSGGGGGTLDQYARDVNVYQNTQITSVQTLAQAAFDQANTGGGGGGGGNNSFTTIASYGQTNIVADSLTDTLTINGGPGIAITTDPATDTITISNTGGGANTGNGTAIPVIVNTFTGNGTQNTFTLSATPGNKDQTLVIVGGVPQAKATYSLANTTLTFTEAPDNGYNIEVIIFAQSTAQGDGISAGKSIALSMIFGG